ncbi:MAG: hypothetical protein ACE5PO_02030, partial [Candidatus Bathyarchaeia archaeon]
MSERSRSRKKRLYSLNVSGRDLHFLRHVLAVFLDRWDTLDSEKKLDPELAATRMLLTKKEAKAMLTRVEECLYRLIPALRHMRMYEGALFQMEPTPSRSEKRLRRKTTSDRAA